MRRYNKAIGAIVGGVVGVILIALGISDSGEVPADLKPAVDALVAMVTSAVGTYLAPANDA